MKTEHLRSLYHYLLNIILKLLLLCDNVFKIAIYYKRQFDTNKIIELTVSDRQN